ncbi:MAG: glucosaminidase domain-containing protein [Candidatus Puniceispirillum sp.]|nr:glucosaminidase domain-containing protein [Candidatus Puniceispirillum sp.]
MLLPRQIENRHILWSALAMLALGLIVPGVFGVKPPQWFAVPQQQEPGQNLAAGSAPTKAQIPATTTPDAKIPDAGATAGITSARPDSAMYEQSSLSANPAIVMVPADFARRIPERHLALSGADQKQSFINLVLPLIVASNDELVQRRNAVKAAFDAKNRAMLEKWAVLYRVDPEKLDDAELAKQLLRRVDTIPVALALAQAAIESGWGTSRFALQGNALFGQWAWTESAGIRPLAASNERAVVRSFGSLLESVRAYMHNLNTHPNYQRFRLARQRLSPQNKTIKAGTLATYLDSYAEIGTAYVDKLRAVMSSNNFDQYARARLR